MRYLIKFSKESDIKFISHLDLSRTIQRIIRRAELPMVYSQGFNPHMSVCVAQPLSVGLYSTGEYIDIELTEELSAIYVKDKLNDNAPRGIKFLDAVKVKNLSQKKIPQCMALIDGADYTIKIRYENTENLKKEMEELLNTKEWVTLKKTKSGEKEADIKPLVKKISFDIKEEVLVVNAVIACGSRENLSADLLARYIQQKTTKAYEEAFVEIKRNELLALNGKKLVPLTEYIRETI